ncbi:NAD(P)H-binding protein [Streptomyces albiaxialis]|uniref:NAD(P)H-binding protein n=1 Tax=Streptomyces albiaxialis TaxID=329523 RepID=A0ABP5I675_9ACTN
MARERTVLVTGGTGTLGRHVVRGLLDAGQRVRVLSRRPRRARDDGPQEWATGDLLTGDGVTEAVAGADVIVHCATGRKDVRATRHLLAACHHTRGNPHLVYVSIVGIDRVRFFYYDAKLACERAVERSGLPWTVLRATQFHDLVARLTTSQFRLPVTLVPSGARFQPVDAGEVAGRLVELALGEPAGRAEDMGGPLVHTSRELALMTLRAYGRRRSVVGVRLPGKAFRALRAGGNLVPDRAVGTVTYAEYLERVEKS